MKVGRLLLRAAVGGFFVGHGTQKLFGWFDGEGLGATAEAFEGMGLKPGKLTAAVAGGAETLGGAGFALGYGTPVAASVLVGTMLTAVDRVHLKNGPWITKGGYEYNVVLAAAAVAVAESGPGAISLDALRGKERSGALWGIFSLALGVGGAAGLRAYASSRAVPAGPVAEARSATPDAGAASEAETQTGESAA
ncbi:MAG: DoxX family protein [Solirubrobacteraceae bacterium]